MSTQHPIHRDRGKRTDGEQPYKDDRETLSEKDAKLAREAAVPGNQGDGLTDAERDELMRASASERLTNVQEKLDDEKTTGEEASDGH